MVEKKAVSWIEFVKITKGKNPDSHLKKVLKMASGEWKKIKSGSHDKYSQGKSPPRTRKKSNSKKGKKHNKSKNQSNDDDNEEECESSRKTSKRGRNCSCCKNLRKEIKKLKEKIEELEK